MRLFHPRAAALVALVSCAAAAGPLEAQITLDVPVQRRSALWVGSPLDDYVRLLQLSGDVHVTSRLLRPLEYDARTLAIPDSGDRATNPWRGRYRAWDNADTTRVGIDLYEPIVRLYSNGAVPFGGNDGAVWEGKGISGAIDLGVAGHYGPLTVRLAPSLIYSQNLPFPLSSRFEGYPDQSFYADPYIATRIDLPQRFGDKPMERLEWGQSSIQLAGHGVQGGVSTENMWWGPGIDNAILMSNNAGGFPHLFLGTQKPADIWIGKLQALYTVGWLAESAFWRAERPDSLTDRWMKALVVVLEPRGAPGLFLGAGRVYYQYVPAEGITLRDMFGIFEPPEKKKLISTNSPLGDDSRDQMIELFMRWVLPESHFEVYASLGRNDHSFDQRDLILEPDHATAYTVGLQKLFLQPGAGFVRLRGELTNLSNGLTQTIRPAPTWYAHHIVSQGYTERGQVIGAQAGPGGRQADLGLDVYRKWGNVGAFVDWRRVNDDFHFSHYGPGSGELYAGARHDVFFGGGVRGTILLKHADVSLGLLKQTEYNRYTFTPGYDYDNLHLELSTQVHW